MLFLKAEQQSICPPYAQKSNSDNKTERKFVNKRKKNETVVMVARLIMDDFTVSISEMAGFCGIDPKKVQATYKKITETLSEEHIIIGLNEAENKKLKDNLDLRLRHISHEKDAFIRRVARVIIEYPRLAGSRIADRLEESTMNVSRAIDKIRNRISKEEIIAGLTVEEYTHLKSKLQQRAAEAALEKEQREKEKEMAKAFREERKNRAASATKKRSKCYTISAMGMAEWNMMSYNPETGRVDYDYIFRNYKKDSPNEIKPGLPIGFPRSIPKKEMAVQINAPDPSYLIPSKASGTAAGRRRVGIMQLS